MMLYTDVSYYDITAKTLLPKYTWRYVEGILTKGYLKSGQYRVVAISSTNPYDYINYNLKDGKLYKRTDCEYGNPKKQKSKNQAKIQKRTKKIR